MNAIIVFDSKHGATADIAARIAEKFGEGVSLVYLRDRGAERVDLADADLVVLGGPVYAGSWSKRAASFARIRERDLAEKAFAYFCCGMNVAEGAAAAAASLPRSLAEKAVAAAKLGGEFRWERMNWLERLAIKAISGKRGDQSVMDRAAVDAFAAQAAAGKPE